MAIKYNTPKKHNAGTKRTSYNNKTGRTRTTITVKNKNTGITRSRSVNKNGSIRQTTTHKSPAGFITRSTKTFGGSVSKPAKPKFVKAPKAKASTWLSVPRAKSASSSSRHSSSGGSRRSRSASSSGTGLGAIKWIVLLLILYWIFV